MVNYCCVESCSSKQIGITFHRLPMSNPERLRQWLFILNIDPKTPNHVLSKLVVCHKHFSDDDYVQADAFQSRRSHILKATAVPTCSAPDPAPGLKRRVSSRGHRRVRGQPGPVLC